MSLFGESRAEKLEESRARSRESRARKPDAVWLWIYVSSGESRAER
jgi:hypothetical protein